MSRNFQEIDALWMRLSIAALEILVSNYKPRTHGCHDLDQGETRDF
jgi:hypothetical protein